MVLLNVCHIVSYIFLMLIFNFKVLYRIEIYGYFLTMSSISLVTVMNVSAMESYLRESFLVIEKMQLQQKREQIEKDRSYALVSNIIPVEFITEMKQQKHTQKQLRLQQSKLKMEIDSHAQIQKKQQQQQKKQPNEHHINLNSLFYCKPFPQMSVLLSDMVSFTNFSATVSAQQVVDMLNEQFSMFDALSNRYDLEKVCASFFLVFVSCCFNVFKSLLLFLCLLLFR